MSKTNALETKTDEQYKIIRDLATQIDLLKKKVENHEKTINSIIKIMSGEG